MKAKKYWILGLLALCCVAFLSAKLSGISRMEKEQLKVFGGNSTLRGLKGVDPGLRLRMLGKGKKRKVGSLTEDDLRTEVNRLLQTTEIRTVKVHPSGGNIGYLIINVEAMKVNKDIPFYAFTVRTELCQYVKLARNDKILTITRTWPLYGFVPTLTIADSNKVEQAIRDEVIRQVEVFINDFLAANLKDAQMITGTVRYLDFEGGFYGLVADDGEKYDPVNLPKEYKQDGLRVKFQVTEKKGMVGFRMWGKIVEVVEIETLQAETRDRL